MSATDTDAGAALPKTPRDFVPLLLPVALALVPRKRLGDQPAGEQLVLAGAELVAVPDRIVRGRRHRRTLLERRRDTHLRPVGHVP